MARLHTFDDPAEFRARAQPFLLADEARNNLLFGVLGGIEQGRYADPLLCILEDGGEVAAVALRTPPHPVLLSFASIDATRALAAALPEQDLSGVNGRADQAHAFAQAWAARTGASFERRRALGIYALTEVHPPEGVAGAARVMEPRDRAVVRGWLEAFESEALSADDPGSGTASGRVDRALSDPEAAFLLWEHGGEPVSVAGMAGPTPSGMRIGPVYTPPEHRRRGYGAAVTAELSARLLASGWRFCFLYTDLANATSNGVYRRIGYEHVDDAADYRFRR